jgi:hypothetical protein
MPRRKSWWAIIVLSASIASVFARSNSSADLQLTPTSARTTTEEPNGPTNDKQRADRATDIFVGRVLSRARDVTILEPRPPFPPTDPQPVESTIYAVEVLETLKGSASEVVIVRQRNEFNHMTSPQNDGDPELMAGEEAVFVCYWESKEWCTLIEGRYGHTRINSDSERAETVDRFRQLVSESATPTTN